VFIYDIPFKIAISSSYSVNLPHVDNVNYSVTCGDLVRANDASSRHLLTIGEVSSDCSLLAGSATLQLWPSADSTPVFRADVEPVVQSYSRVFYVGEYFEIYAPSKYDHVDFKKDALQTYYYTNVSLPDGLSLTPSNGFIAGSFQTPLKGRDFSVYLRDPVTQQSKLVLTIEGLEVLPLPSTSSSLVPPASYSVPLGALLIILLIAYLHWRNDRKKEYHIFLSYRGS
jgi:hypothetical protein